MPFDAQRKPNGRAAVGVMGLTAALLCGALLDTWEGNKLKPYQDIVKVWTNCRGNTKDVDPTHIMTADECDVVNDEQLAAHAKPVLQCVPQLKGRPNALAASVSLAYNIGTAGYCRSTAAARFRAGDVRGGCDALLKFRFAGGREVRGLLNRRKAEREICLRDS